MWKEFIGRLDEILGASMLTAVAIIAMVLEYDAGTAQMCITGVVALLAVKAAKGGSNDRRETKESPAE
jgi:hypothetical protein